MRRLPVRSMPAMVLTTTITNMVTAIFDLSDLNTTSYL
jgi:hypothetical protein